MNRIREWVSCCRIAGSRCGLGGRPFVAHDPRLPAVLVLAPYMRFLPTLLLLLVLPGLLLPAGFVLSLCPCAERAEPTA